MRYSLEFILFLFLLIFCIFFLINQNCLSKKIFPKKINNIDLNKPKYLYLIPMGGLNDILTRIKEAKAYCQKNNRLLLIDTVNSEYHINWSDYFKVPYSNVIYDFKIIKQIIIDNYQLSVYPKSFKEELTSLLTGKIKFNHLIGNYFFESKSLTVMSKPIFNQSADIIINVECGGGNGYDIFKDLIISLKLKKYCQLKYRSLPTKYLGLQIRNTDIKNSYQALYQKNKKLIDKYKNIYLATDDPKVIHFFKSKNLKIYNFTTFNSDGYKNLHNSNLPGYIKIRDLVCDIFLLSQSDYLLSTSKGGFIKLLRNCFKNKKEIIQQFS